MICSKLPRRFMRLAKKRGKLQRWLDMSKKEEILDTSRAYVETLPISHEVKSWPILKT